MLLRAFSINGIPRIRFHRIS